MFNHKTLLVVGSGASREAELPTGPELARVISGLLTFRFDLGVVSSGDKDFVQGLSRHFGSGDIVNQHLEVAAQIASGVRRVNSIDNYIDTHRHDSRISALGKAAIVYSILKAERSSSLFCERDGGHRMDFNRLEPTWYTKLGRMVVDRVALPQVEAVFSDLTVICFNYDRCIEEFLAHWLVSVYALQLSQARSLVGKLNILRPYGLIGHDGKRALGTKFGEEPWRIDFAGMASGITTYTQQVEDKELLGKLKMAVEHAETIVFLGFGFHSQNMKLIQPTRKSKATQVYASAFGFSKTDGSDIERALHKLVGSGRASPATVHVRTDLTCAGLLDEFKRSLAG